MKKQKRAKRKQSIWYKKVKPWVFIVLFAVLGYFVLHLSLAASVYSPPTTIASNCSVDVGAALSTWLQSVPNGSTIQFKKDACYLNNRYIRLDNKQNLVIDGNNAVFKRTQLSPSNLSYPQANPHWWFKGGSNITVKNMQVQGINTKTDNNRPGYGSYVKTYEFEAAFRVEQISNSRFENLKLDAIYGDGIQLQDSNNATVVNSSIDRNGRQGIALINTSNVKIDTVKILHSRRAGVDLENNTSNQTISNVEIKNSSFASVLLALPAGGPGAVNNINFHDNQITATGTPFVYNYRAGSTVRRSNWKIYNNVVKARLNSPQPAILMANTDNIEIKQNTVPLSTTQSRQAVKLQDSGGSLVVRDNYFENATSSYVTSGKVAAVTACSNKLTAAGAFNQPLVCPVVINPPPGGTDGGNSGGTNGSTNGGSSGGTNKNGVAQTSGPNNSFNSLGGDQGSDASQSPESKDNHSSALKTPISKAANNVKKLSKSGSGKFIIFIFVAAALFLGLFLYRRHRNKLPWLR